MLERILQEIRLGGTLDATALAARLDTSPQMVQAMLDHLQRAGYLRMYTNCGDGCSGCGLRDACNLSQKPHKLRLWRSVTDDA